MTTKEKIGYAIALPLIIAIAIASNWYLLSITVNP